MRLFIAIQLSEKIVDQLCLWQHKMLVNVVKARVIAKENLHLTLFFLGETELSKLAKIKELLQKVSELNSPFMLTLNNRLETFYERNPANVVWVRTGGDLSALEHLQGMIGEAMVSCGFKSKEPLFLPHVTIARNVYCKKGVRDICGERLFYKSKQIPSMTVNCFLLMESIVKNDRRVYETRGIFNLKNK